MKIGIEHVRVLEKWKSKCYRITLQGNFYGIILNDNTTAETEIFAAIKGLKMDYLFYKETWGSQKKQKSGGMAIHFWLPWETECDKEYGDKISIGYHRDADHILKGKPLRFITINITRFSAKRGTEFYQDFSEDGEPVILKQLSRPLI